MAIKDTCKTLRTLLEGIQGDLDKAEAGNKAAAQRVRTATIRFEKTAKHYRKESIKADKSGLMKKAKEANRKKPAAKKSKSAAAPKASKAPARKPAAKKAAKPASAKKRPTAKLPKRKKK